MSKKQAYRVRNWKEYNKALVHRGSLTVWFDQDSLQSWYNSEQTGKRGRPQIYSDLAIQCCLTLKSVFKLPLRATQGFVGSLLEILALPLTAPDYSLLSIRQKSLQLVTPPGPSRSRRLHLVIDSTGLKLHGEGEWKVKKHGQEKRRRWVKLHLGIDERNQTIEASLITADNVNDCQALPALLEQLDSPLQQVTGDRAYDTFASYASVIAKGAKPCFPPKVNAVRQKAIDEAHRLRNHAVSEVRYQGMADWKEKHNYHRRSLAETGMFRFKQLMGDRVQARTIERQCREIAIKCLAMNKITQLGMPISEMI